jgi:hypothetical protein
MFYCYPNYSFTRTKDVQIVSIPIPEDDTTGAGTTIPGITTIATK